MNEISYDKWQQIIRLPYLIVLAFWIGQRTQLYPSQMKRMLTKLEAIHRRDPDRLLGQLAADSVNELINHLEQFKAEEISHFSLQCARVITASRAVMTEDQFRQYLQDNNDIVQAMQQAIPWHGRLRVMLQKRLPQDPRVTLRNALDDAALKQST